MLTHIENARQRLFRTLDWTDVALPDLQDARYAIVRVDALTICGTTLHFLTGDVLEVKRLGRHVWCSPPGQPESCPPSLTPTSRAGLPGPGEPPAKGVLPSRSVLLSGVSAAV